MNEKYRAWLEKKMQPTAREHLEAHLRSVITTERMRKDPRTVERLAKHDPRWDTAPDGWVHSDEAGRSLERHGFAYRDPDTGAYVVTSEGYETAWKLMEEFTGKPLPEKLFKLYRAHLSPHILEAMASWGKRHT